MDDNQLNNLIKWLKTFDLKTPHSVPEDLTSGAALAETLTQIAPEWFTTTWYSKIKIDVGLNWRLKVSNLKKVIEGIMEYYIECLNQPLTRYEKPNAHKIGEESDFEELTKLLQLVLGCAVNCNNKQHFITRIMGLDESLQQTIMLSIQELENSIYGPRMSLGANLKFETTDTIDEKQQMLLNELQTAIDSKDQMIQRCNELDKQLTFLEKEKNYMLTENENLQSKIDEYENLKIKSSFEQSELRKQVDTLKDEIFNLEASRDDYKFKVELSEKEMVQLKSKQLEYEKSMDLARNLKDEVYSLREAADKVVHCEAVIETYKKKFEDYNNLKREMRNLEEQNTKLLHDKVIYEDEVKKIPLLKTSLDKYKQEFGEMYQKLQDETNKSVKLEMEKKDLFVQLNLVQRERDRLIIERNTLTEIVEEVKYSEINTDAAVDNSKLIPFAEKLILLQEENKILKMDQQGGGEQVSDYALVKELEERLRDLTVQNKDGNQRIRELEKELEKLQSKEQFEPEINSQDEVIQLKTECDRLYLLNEEHENYLQSQEQKIIVLQTKLVQKRTELSTLEDRFKKYIEKAKIIIQILDPKQESIKDAKSSAEIELINREKLKKLKKERDVEKKLMMSAFYNYGLTKHREIVDQKVNTMNSYIGQSFLERHRKPMPKNYNY